MIAPCGVNCDECPSFVGTITGDETVLREMIRMYGDENSAPLDFVCLGCKYPDPKLLATYCSECGIRSCAMQRGKDFCATCVEYEACETVKPFRGDGTSPRDKMNAFIRAKYFHQN